MNNMLEHFHIDDVWFSNFFDSIVVEAVEPIGPYRASVMRATGMTSDELDEFLDAKGLLHSRNHISALAIDELKNWYVVKMRRYVRNALAIDLETGSIDEVLFLEFCFKYKRKGHQEVASWDDIDEIKLLQDFEEACYEQYFLILPADIRGNLLNRIHKSYLFHLRLKTLTIFSFCRVSNIISFILCNRYHIFTTEADANAEATNTLARRLMKKWFNPPRYEILYGLAS